MSDSRLLLREPSLCLACVVNGVVTDDNGGLLIGVEVPSV